MQVPEMLQTMVSALEGKDENAAQEALEMFISIAESYPRFLRRQLEQVLALMLRVRSGAPTALAGQQRNAVRCTAGLTANWLDCSALCSSGCGLAAALNCSAMQLVRATCHVDHVAADSADHRTGGVHALAGS